MDKYSNTNLGIGENITQFSNETKAEEVVQYWYNENQKYEYECMGSSKKD